MRDAAQWLDGVAMPPSNVTDGKPCASFQVKAAHPPDLRLRGPTEPLQNDKILPNKFDDLLIYLSGLQVSSMILVQSPLPTHCLLLVECR